MVRRSLILALMIVGCGGAPPATPDQAPEPAAKAEPAPEPKAAGPSPADKCIADANSDIAKPIAIPSDITVSQVLIKHKDAKQADGSAHTREEACLRALEAMEALKEGKSFEDVVGEYSESKGAATTGGLIGKVKPGELGDDKLNEAAFALGVNQVSNVIESSFGFHIILRTR